MEFTLDTSGHVALDPRPFFPDWDVDEHGCVIRWSDLAPFTQGYVEALFAGPFGERKPEEAPLAAYVGFSDLAPETLARILKDCERFLASGAGENTREHGLRFWAMRVRPQIGGGWHPDFPPLTPYLGDDGLVYLREAGEWSGSPDPADPDNYWIDDRTGERVCAKTGERTLSAKAESRAS